MATLEQLSAALVKADAAGNADDARALATEIRKMRSSSAAEAVANDPIMQGAKNFASDMSFMEKFNAGAGKAFNDIGQGIGQRIGLVSNDDIKETRRLDAPLMETGAAKAGNIGANVAMLAPAALVPGAATIPGAAVIGGVIGAVQPSASTGEAFLNTGMGAAGGALGQGIANKAAGSVAFQQANNAKAASQFAQKAAAAKNASASGYVIPPEDLGGGLATQLLSGVGGKVKTAQVASERNQPVTNELAKRALGMAKDDPLTEPALQAIRNTAGKAYDVVKGSGTVAADANYVKALDGIAAQYTTASQAFPGAVKSEIPELVAALKQPSFGADGAVEMTKVLRQRADQAFASGDKGTGKAIKEAADALEGMLERHLQNAGLPDALQAFRDARQTIAKTYTVRKALNPSTGDVSAKVLATLADKGKPLTGELATIAQAGQAFPKATQLLKEAPKTFSPLDMAMATINGPLMGAASLGTRPAARSALLSAFAQRSMLETAGVPAQTNALTRLLANDDFVMPLGIAGGLAAGGAANR